MPRPFLLIETPRAGEMNHRFICSPGAGLTDAAARDLVWAALDQPAGALSPSVGADFVAVVRRGVFQARSDRRGDEVLLLGGVDPARLDIPAVAARLDARMAEVKGLAEDVAHARGLLVEHEALGRWLAELSAALPAAPASPGRPALRRWAGAATAVLVSACALAGAWYAIASGGQAVPEEPGPGEEAGAAAPAETDEQKISRLADALTSAYAKLQPKRSVDRSAVELDLKEDDGRLSKDIDKFLSDLDLKDPAGVAPRLRLKESGKALAGLGVPLRCPAGQARDLRAYLRCWRKQGGALRKAAQAFFGDRAEESAKDLKRLPVYGLLCELAMGRPEYKALDENAGPEPVLPWLSEADRRTAEAMHQLLVESAAGKPFRKHDHPDLLGAVGALHEQAPGDLFERFRNERRDFRDRFEALLKKRADKVDALEHAVSTFESKLSPLYQPLREQARGGRAANRRSPRSRRTVIIL